MKRDSHKVPSFSFCGHLHVSAWIRATPPTTTTTHKLHPPVCQPASGRDVQKLSLATNSSRHMDTQQQQELSRSIVSLTPHPKLDSVYLFSPSRPAIKCVYSSNAIEFLSISLSLSLSLGKILKILLLTFLWVSQHLFMVCLNVYLCRRLLAADRRDVTRESWRAKALKQIIADLWYNGCCCWCCSPRIITDSFLFFPRVFLCFFITHPLMINVHCVCV